MSQVRNYSHVSEVSVGDIVRCFDDAFGTAIVERIIDDQVYLVRPMARADGDTGSAWLHTERYRIPLERFAREYKVYTYPSGQQYNRRF